MQTRQIAQMISGSDSPDYSCWSDAIKNTLAKLEPPVFIQRERYLVSTKSLLDTVLKPLGGNPDDKGHQTRVGNILKTVGWTKTYQPKSQVGGKRERFRYHPHLKLSQGGAFSQQKKPQTIAKFKREQPYKKYNAQPQAKKKTRSQKVINDSSVTNQLTIHPSDIHPVDKLPNQIHTVYQLCDVTGSVLKIGDKVTLSSDSRSLRDWEILHLWAEDTPELQQNYLAEVVAIKKCCFDDMPRFLLKVQWVNGKERDYCAVDIFSTHKPHLIMVAELQKIDESN